MRGAPARGEALLGRSGRGGRRRLGRCRGSGTTCARRRRRRRWRGAARLRGARRRRRDPGRLRGSHGLSSPRAWRARWSGPASRMCGGSGSSRGRGGGAAESTSGHLTTTPGVNGDYTNFCSLAFFFGGPSRTGARGRLETDRSRELEEKESASIPERLLSPRAREAKKREK